MERELVVRADRTDPDDLAGTPFAGLDVRTLVSSARNAAELTTIGQTIYPSDGTTHEAHLHPHAEETVIVLEGRGLHQIGERVYEIAAGDVVLIPRGAVHAAKATGGEELRIIWVLGGAGDLEHAGYQSSDAGLL